MDISLTPESEAIINKLLASGDYKNASEVLDDALQRLGEGKAWQELRTYLAPRIAQADCGEFSTQNILEIAAETKRNFVSGK